MDNSSANKRLARNSIFMSIRMVIVLLITLYITRAVLSVLGVEDYGVYNVVCGFVSLFTFLNTSMSNGIQRFFNYELGKNGEVGANRVYNMAILIQILISLIIVIFAETFGLWYLNCKMVIPLSRIVAANWIFQFSIISFVFIIMQVPYTAAVMAHEKMDFYSVVSVLDVILKLLIVLFLPFINGDHLIIYGLLYVIISVLDFIIYYVYAKHSFSEIVLKFKFNKILFQEMLSFSGWNVFGSFANMMKEQGINLVINLFFGPVVNAARGIAAQVNSGLQGFVQNITVPVRPQIVQSYACGNISRTMNLMYTVSKLSCYFLFVMSLPILLEINTILHIWLGDNIPEHTNSFVIIIVATSFINNLNSAVSNVVHATGKMKIYQVTGSICILLSIPLAYIVLKLGYDVEWAILMSFLSMTLAQVVALFVLEKLIEFSIKEYLKHVICPFLFVIILSVWVPYIFHFYMQESIIRLFVVGFVSIITSSLIVYKVGLCQSEREILMSLIKKVKK